MSDDCKWCAEISKVVAGGKCTAHGGHMTATEVALRDAANNVSPGQGIIMPLVERSLLIAQRTVEDENGQHNGGLG